jgi:hypothetical protein
MVTAGFQYEGFSSLFFPEKIRMVFFVLIIMVLSLLKKRKIFQIFYGTKFANIQDLLIQAYLDSFPDIAGNESCSRRFFLTAKELPKWRVYHITKTKKNSNITHRQTQIIYAHVLFPKYKNIS